MWRQQQRRPTLPSPERENELKIKPSLELPKPCLDLGPLLGAAAVALADTLGNLSFSFDRQHLGDLGLVPAEIGALEVLLCFLKLVGFGRGGRGREEKR